MGIFRQFKRDSQPESGSYPILVAKNVTSTSESGVSTVFVQSDVKDVTDYGNTLDMPSSDEYRLEDMLKSGDVPREVPTVGLLTPTDSCDPRVSAELSDMVDQLHNIDPDFSINN